MSTKYDYLDPEIHWNHANVLPPVGSRMIIDVDGKHITVRRMSYLKNLMDDLKYQDEDGNEITGRYRWRYL